MGWSERQQCLKEQYFFDCHCKPCIDGEASEALFVVSCLVLRTTCEALQERTIILHCVKRFFNDFIAPLRL